jgi:hypothetical protein
MYRVLNARESSPLYKRLILDIEKEIEDAEQVVEGPCAFVMMTQIDAYFNHTSNITNMMKEAKAKEGKGGTNRKTLLKDLMNNYDVTFYIAPKLKPRKGKKRRDTVESLLRMTDVERKLLISFTKQHVGIVAEAKGNKFIDLYGPYVEYDLDYNADKLVVVNGVKPEEEEDVTEDKSQDESKE